MGHGGLDGIGVRGADDDLALVGGHDLLDGPDDPGLHLPHRLAVGETGRRRRHLHDLPQVGAAQLVDLGERFRVMDRFEEYQQILSIATPPIEVFSSGADSVGSHAKRNGRHVGATARL